MKRREINFKINFYYTIKQFFTYYYLIEGIASPFNSCSVSTLPSKKLQRHMGHRWSSFLRNQSVMHSLWKTWIHSSFFEDDISVPSLNDSKQIGQFCGILWLVSWSLYKSVLKNWKGVNEKQILESNSKRVARTHSDIHKSYLGWKDAQYWFSSHPLHLCICQFLLSSRALFIPGEYVFTSPIPK